MAKKPNFYRDLNHILVGVFTAGRDRRPMQDVLDDAHSRIKQLLDEAEIVRLQQVAGASRQGVNDPQGGL